MQQELNIPPASGKAFTASGMKGYSAVAVGDTPFGKRRIRYAVVNRGNDAYIFAGTARSTGRAGKYDEAVLATAKSLHPLTDAEKRLAREKKLDIIRAPGGTTWADLARRSPIANYPEEQLRLLNDQYPSGEPATSEIIKIVR
jgi:predicted Zn-dependent protease